MGREEAPNLRQEAVQNGQVGNPPGGEERAQKESLAYIKSYLDRAQTAQREFETYTQEEIDAVVKAVGKVVYQNAQYLAELAVEETGMGLVEDKTAKNKSKAAIIWNSLRDKKSVGILSRDQEAGIVEIAKPMGVVAAITPCTNPIVTPMSNAMFALKGGNAIIITPHHKAIRCSTAAIDLINEALAKLGAPKYLVQILSEQSRENTRNLIANADVVIATGGAGMVHAAYSSGRPALGVGAGNVQCIIDRGIDYGEAVPKIIAGRAFDNGIICSGEQTVIAPAEDFDRIMEEFRKNGAYLVQSTEEKEALRKAMFVDDAMNRHAIGQSAEALAKLAKIEIPQGTKLFVAEADGPGEADLLSKEKMCPVLAAYRYEEFSQAVDIAQANLELEGKGHSVAIHSHNEENIEYAGKRLSVCRFVINQVCASSAGGSFFNGLAPTNTLGCGSWGHNSISENLNYRHLINISRIAYFMPGNHVPTESELWD